MWPRKHFCRPIATCPCCVNQPRFRIGCAASLRSMSTASSAAANCRPCEAFSAKDERSEPSGLAEAHELSELVNSEVARLPERERIVIALFYTADRPLADVAAFLGVPTSTIQKPV